MPKRSALDRHLELERLFGSDFLPASRSAGSSAGPDDFEAFRAQVLGCRRCGLCGTRTQVVFGVGNVKAPVVFVGEAPGADEDLQGEPFVGRAGQLLTKTLAKFGVGRERVYIANILKCRPPGNRTPAPEEMLACMPWLTEQLRRIDPPILCAMGNIAVKGLLNTETGITKLRGRYHPYQGRKLFATFHPAYILRNMTDLPLFEADLQRVLTDAGLVPPSSI